MKNLLIATGNNSKFYEATQVFKGFDIDVEQAKVDIDEIQHKDPVTITKAKVKSAFELLKRPVAVNDSFWEIPALNGFPGAYMKDVTGWLATEDFLNLMKDKEDKSIILHECTAFFDGETLETFVHDRPGHFVDIPKGNSLPTFARVVEIDGDGMTISEIFDQGEWDVTPERHKHWYDLAKWYADEYLVKQNSK